MSAPCPILMDLVGEASHPQDDLSQYSTTIDLAKLPEKQRKKAEKVAKEIELRQCCRGRKGAPPRGPSWTGFLVKNQENMVHISMFPPRFLEVQNGWSKMASRFWVAVRSQYGTSMGPQAPNEPETHVHGCFLHNSVH